MLYFLGLIFMAIAGVMIAPIPAALIFNEVNLIPHFLIPAIASLTIGIIFWLKFEYVELTLGKAMVLASFGWLLLALFGSIPYILGVGFSFLDAYFESMSGFTTTGLTMFPMPGPGLIDAPKTILLWRSFTQWVGGIGVIVLFLSAILGVGGAVKKLYAAEGGGGRIGPDKRRPLEPTVRATARSVWKIYGLYTLIAALGMYILGMPIFESVNHAITALATGGFSVTSDSFASYGAPILIFTLLPMLAGATSFAVHREFLGGNWKALFKNVEFKLMVGVILLSTLILMWVWGPLNALFQSTTASTTVGFSSTNIVTGPDFAKGVLTILMVIGGGFGSTASAIKLIRTIIIIGALYWLIKQTFLPERAVVPIKIGDNVFSESEVSRTAIFGFIYIVALTAGSLITMIAMPDQCGINAIFDSASAQGNVGLSTGLTSAAMPAVVKFTYILQMWIGRLEILPVAALLGYLIRKTPKTREAF